MPTPDSDTQDLNNQMVEQVALLATLTAKVEALGEQAQEKRRELRETFREAHVKRFGDIDPKRALIGAKTEHELAIKDVVSFYLRPPTAATTHAVDKFIGEPNVADPADSTKSLSLGPVGEAERMLMAWLVGVHLRADVTAKRQEVDGLSPGRRLQMLRGLPEDLIRRVAEEAGLLQSWLNVVLEIELGNF